MDNKKGLIPFGGLGKNLGATKGSGGALQKMRQQTELTTPAKPVNSFAAMQAAVEQRNAISSIVYGLDYTASTSDVIPQFKKITTELSRSLDEEFGNPDQFFGTFSGRGINIGGVNDTSPLERYNSMGNSDVPRYINEVVDNKIDNSSKNPVMFIFGDELDWDDNVPYGSGDKVLDDAIKKLREKSISLFFIYENTGGGNNSRDEIISELIKPLGEKGSLIDMTDVDVTQLVDIIKGCVSYSVQSAVSTANTGKNQITLQDYLKSKGVGNLQISQGEAPKQLGKF